MQKQWCAFFERAGATGAKLLRVLLVLLTLSAMSPSKGGVYAFADAPEGDTPAEADFLSLPAYDVVLQNDKTDKNDRDSGGGPVDF